MYERRMEKKAECSPGGARPGKKANAKKSCKLCEDPVVPGNYGCCRAHRTGPRSVLGSKGSRRKQGEAEGVPQDGGSAAGFWRSRLFVSNAADPR